MHKATLVKKLELSYSKIYVEYHSLKRKAKLIIKYFDSTQNLSSKNALAVELSNGKQVELVCHK